MQRRVGFLALVALLACGASTEPGSIVGTYILRTINASALPFTVEQDAFHTLEVLDDEVVISAANTFIESGHVRLTLTPGGVTPGTVADTGTYARVGSSITLSSGNGSVSGSITESALTIVSQGLTYLYER
jgi:hypothetical protein